MVRLMNCPVLVGPRISPLILLALLGGHLVPASSILRSQDGNGPLPSAATLAGCQTSCGNLTFNYPFGTGGSHCFRAPDFELTCNETVHPPRLLLRDGITQVTNNIVTTDTGSPYRGDDDIYVALTYTIPMRHGINAYNVSWVSPAKSFALSYAWLNVTGCNFDIYLIDRDSNITSWVCTLTCPAGEIMETMVIQNCNGTGCCPIVLETTLRSFALNFVRHNNGSVDAWSNRSSLWDSIKVTTYEAGLSWHIMDQQKCASAKENKTNFACVGKNTRCMDSEEAFDFGYFCKCYPGYVGNPYLLNGCLRDKGYHPAPQKDNCSSFCGNINVPFPFGIEEGCSARKDFFLNCTNMTTSTLLLGNGYLVKDIDVHEGLIKLTELEEDEELITSMSNDGPSIFIESGGSTSMKWVAANLTCPEAQANKSGYACVSTNSKCVAVNSSDIYVGYQCKCLDGFRGNPYVLIDGCQDIDECSQPNRCSEICENTIGGFNCTACPPKTIYDPVKLQCRSSAKQQSVLVGTIIGLSSGFGVLAVSVSVIFLTRRWKRNIQKRMRRKYFRKNQGLLLEQLVLSDESASDKKRIFTLEELEKATNNFDSTRVLGRGGHGMVYKGILSDQRVVAIKRSKIIEEDEINQFINEVAILSQINHRNIVKLFGCCLETEVPLLVYEFIPNGSLHDILHADAGNELLLSWDSCLRIAAEAAGALCYLHSAASVSVFHRDVKSSNILLDSNYTAKVSDFGASRLVPIDQTHVVTNVQGTFGYLDPEYYHTGQLNEKSDVYSFGVLLLELLTRKEPILTNVSGAKQNLANYFLLEMKTRPITEIVAPLVLDEASKEEINCFASLVEMCLRLQGNQRPTMKQVEIALRFLRTRRLESSEPTIGKDEEMQALLTGTEIKSYELSAIDISKRSKISSSKNSQKFHSLEQEFMSTASLPR